MDRFGDAAARLAGVAGLLLGWRPGEFWSATPAELEAVLRAMGSDAGEALPMAEAARLMEIFPDG